MVLKKKDLRMKQNMLLYISLLLITNICTYIISSNIGVRSEIENSSKDLKVISKQYLPLTGDFSSKKYDGRVTLLPVTIDSIGRVINFRSIVHNSRIYYTENNVNYYNYEKIGDTLWITGIVSSKVDSTGKYPILLYYYVNLAPRPELGLEHLRLE
jgi:hypothetical protein